MVINNYINIKPSLKIEELRSAGFIIDDGDGEIEIQFTCDNKKTVVWHIYNSKKRICGFLRLDLDLHADIEEIDGNNIGNEVIAFERLKKYLREKFPQHTITEYINNNYY